MKPQTLRDLADDIDHLAALEEAAALIPGVKQRIESLRVELGLVPPPVVEPPVVIPPPPPEPVGPVVNPFCIAYDGTANLDRYAQPGGLIVCGRKRAVFHTAPEMQAARARGAKLLQYIVPSDWPDALNSDYDRDYYGGFSNGPAYWPHANRSKWPGTRMADVTPGSAWISYSISYMMQMYATGKVDGFFLDTVGGRTYASGADWGSWSDLEKNDYMYGNVDLVSRLDGLLPVDAILVNNSVWHADHAPQFAEEGGAFVNGSCLEHHASTSTWHRNYANRTFGRSPRYMLVIANSQEDAREWAKVPGVTHVCGQKTSEYGNPLEPAIGFNVRQV